MDHAPSNRPALSEAATHFSLRIVAPTMSAFRNFGVREISDARRSAVNMEVKGQLRRFE